MKSLCNLSIGFRHPWCWIISPIFMVLILLFVSCTDRREPYSIIEFTGAEYLSNYSKSFYLTLNTPDSANRTIIMCSSEDLLISGDFIFLFNEGNSETRFHLRYDKNVWYINDKIYSIYIPDNDDMIPWFKNMKGSDLSELQFINFDEQFATSYLPYLAGLAKIKPDAGLYYSGNFEDITELMTIFNPGIILCSNVLQSDYGQLEKLTRLEILMIKPDETLSNFPLPFLPELRHLYLTDMDEKTDLSDQFLVNNKQIARLIIHKTGNLDLSILKPLKNLKALVVTGSDSIFNIDEINNHKNLEVLSLTGSPMIFDPLLISLPSLRWVAFPSDITQEEFNSFVASHPDLEIIELARNRNITSLLALTGLSKLTGLIVTDNVIDPATIKTLMNLKYLSLPSDFLDTANNKAELMESLPDVRMVGNEGFCLGSGWLLLIIPLVLIIRFCGIQKKKGFSMIK